MSESLIYITFSSRQRAFHQEPTLESMIESNLTQLSQGLPADFVVVATATDQEDANAVIDRLRKALLTVEELPSHLRKDA